MPFPTPQQDADARCLDCGHALSGLEEARCPECGRIFAFGEPSTWGSRHAGAALARRLRRPPGLAHSLVVVGLGVLFLGIHSSVYEELFDLLGSIVLMLAMAVLFGIKLMVGAAGWWRSRSLPANALTAGEWARWLFAPLFLAMCLWAGFSGAARGWRWAFDEPRLRAEALRLLANPAAPSQGWSTRHFGTVGVRKITMESGCVCFHTTYTELDYNRVELVYCPAGAAPPAGTGLGGGWVLRLGAWNGY